MLSWRKVILVKYDFQPSEWVSKIPSGPQGVDLWKLIHSKRDMFSNSWYMKWKMSFLFIFGMMFDVLLSL